MATKTKTNTRIRFEPSKRFTITQDHIDRGTPECITACAGVLAVEEAFNATRVVVHNGKVAFTVDGWRYYFDVPMSFQKFLKAYDAPGGRKAAKPTSVILTNGYAVRAVRTGARDKTQYIRHALGGRAARIGYKGRRVVLTKRRVAGNAVYSVMNL